LQAHPIKQLAGHEHVAPGRKRDPGPGFDWPRLHLPKVRYACLMPLT
jgi:AmpD protein